VLIALIAVLATASSQAAQSQPEASSLRTFHLTDPRSGECVLWTAIEQLARQARLRIGFEAKSRCDPGAKAVKAGDDAVTFQVSAPVEALDRLLQLSPEFSWREIGGIVVIRPKDAWSDPANALNQAVGRFRVTDAHPHFAVHEALQAARPSLLVPHTELTAVSMGRPLQPHVANGVSVQFEGGTLIEALNAIVGGFDGVWQVGYTGKTFHVVLHAFDFQETPTHIPGRRSAPHPDQQ